jgi:hypothetical protein
VRGWNWGAFLMSWIWGLMHGKPLLALLALVPGPNFVMPFVFGAKGNQWAWEHKGYSSEEDLRADQRPWLLIGIALWLVGGISIVLAYLV